MHKAFRYRLKPNEEQRSQLQQVGGGCRWLWNHMLEANKTRYDSEKKFVFKNDMVASLPALKEQHPWLSDLPSQALQQRCWDLDTAMKRCFRSGFGFPQFKQKDDRSDTFRVSQTNGHIKLTKSAIKIPKLGWIKWKRHHPTEGRLISITVKQEGEHWYVSCLCDIGIVPSQINVREDDIIGIDLGLSHFAVTSDGEVFDIAKPDLRRVKRAQRKLSRIDLLNKKHHFRHSKRRSKQKGILAKLHAKIRHQRSDFHHKTSRKIANFYSFAGMEDLNIKGMLKNRCLASKIAMAGWASFRGMIEYKLAAKGGKMLLVDRFHPSTKCCSSCGHKQEMPLNQRVFLCESCGMVMDRDANAAINLKLWAIREMHRAGTARIYARGDTAVGDMAIDMSRYVSMKREKVRDNVLDAAASSGRR